jgi:hypothetical protein
MTHSDPALKIDPETPSGLQQSRIEAGASLLQVPMQVESLVKAVQNIFAFVLGLASFLTAGGFIVVNTYLSKYTGIQGYNIDPKQYLAAGVGLLIPILIATALVAILYLIGLSYGERLNRISSEGHDAGRVVAVERQLANRIQVRSAQSKKRLRRLRYWVLFIGIVYYTIFFGMLYGQYIYGTIPRFLGGGKPEPMIVVFNDAELPGLFNLSTDPVQNRRTNTVLLLAELADGFLILDTNTGQVAAIKNGIVTGIMAVATPQPTSTPVLTPTP